MASTSPSNQRPPPRKGTRSHRSNTLQQPSQPNKENHAVEEVVMTDVVSHGDAGTKQINQYVFQHKLGRGQHGEVFVAFDQIKNCEVAIKAVRRKNPKIDRMNQFRKKNLPHSPHTPVTDNLGSTELKIRKEIAIMKKCRHPHVVRLLEVIDDKLSEKIYMVMEYLAGGEIKWRTTSEEPALRVDQTRRICRDVILGLEYLHHQGIIHRDIKPANLLWTADRRMVKIADFGVSHFSAAQYLSSSGQPDIRDPILMDESDLSKFAGTPMFLAPEIISDTSESTAANLDQLGTASTTGTSTTMTKKKQPITKAIDIWAFGVTLYALLFGQLPFKADGEYQIYSVIRTEDWDVPETMGCDCLPVGGRHQESPPSGQETEGFLVVALLQKLLEKDVKKRITLDDVKRHPWIIRDMANADDWLRYTRVGQDSLSPTEHETRSAISSVRFRWSDTRLMKGISSIVKTVRVPRVRRVPSSRLREAAEAKEYKKYKDVGTRSAPQAHMSRHKSTTAVIDGRGKAKEVTSHVEPQPRRQAPRAETSSMASVKSSQTRTSSIVPFSSWAAGNHAPSGRRSRRNSSSSSSPAIAINSVEVSSLTVPPGSSRVGSPQPPTPSSAYSAGYGTSQIPSPVSDQSPSQPTPPERPLSRISNFVMRWLGGKSPHPSGSSATSTYSRGPSPQEASTSSLVPASTALAPSALTGMGSGSMGVATGRQIVRRDLSVRRSEDAFHHMRGRQSSGSGEPLSLAMRAASWGEVRPSEDMTSLYSGERDVLDQETMLLGAGGVAQSPVSSIPTGSGVLSTVSSSVSLGPPALSPAQALMLSRTDNNTELPSAPDPAAHDLHRQTQYRATHHPTTSPLARPSFSRGEITRSTTSYSSSSDSDELFGGQRTPSELDYHPSLQRSTSQMYREEDDASSDSEEVEIPLEVRTRRPSASIDAAARPRPPSPPRRKQSQQSERTMICT